MGIKVSLVHSKSNTPIKDSINKAVNLIDFKIRKPISSVIIKPNLCYYWDASTGYTTDPLVVAGIIDWVREECGSNVDIKVVESDATAMRTKYAFKMLGYETMAITKGVELHNLSIDERISHQVYVQDREINFTTSKLLMDSDLFINVPKIKIGRLTKITCAMKNIFGCISNRRKVQYHPFINHAIVGINKLVKPHLTIVDGLVGLGSMPVKLDLLMASQDAFSTDCIASKIIGYKPKSIDCLKIAAKENLGNFDGIDVTGETLEKFQDLFPKLSFISTENSWPFLLWLLKTYSRIVNDVIPPILDV